MVLIYYINLRSDLILYLIFPVVILALPLSELRTWMLAAYDNGMVDGDYVFIYLYNEIPSLQFKISVLETQFYNYGDERDPDGLVAYESLFVVCFLINNILLFNF